MKETLRHLLNPLHVYCRLRQCGFDSARALRLCSVYERIYTQFL